MEEQRGRDNRQQQQSLGADAFRLFVDAVEDYAIYMLDAQGCVITWNRGAQRLKQYTSGEIIGHHFSLFYLPDDVDAGKPQAALASALAAGHLQGEGLRRRKDGSVFRARVAITPVYDAAGQHIGFGKVTRDITGELSAALSRSVLANVLDGIICIDERGDIHSFNPAAESIFGYTQAQLLGKNVRLLMPEPYHSEHDSYLSNYVRTGEAKIIGIGREVRGQRNDGSTFPLELAVSEFEFDGHRYFTGIVRDITERKASAEHERRIQQRMEDAQRVAHVGSWEWDIAADKLIVSDEYYRISGLPVDHANLDMALGASLIHPDDRERIIGLREALLGGGSQHFEYRLVRPSGELRFVQGRAECVHGPDGQPQLLRGTLQDISDLKQIELELRRIQQRMENAQSRAHVGDWELELATNTASWSDELRRIYGLPPAPAPVDREAAAALIHPDDRERVQSTIAAARQSAADFELEYRIVRADALRYLQVRGESVPDAAGQPSLLRGTVQDITDRKLAEERLRLSQERMERAQRVAQIGDWEWDFAHDRVVWSDEYYRIFGLDPATVTPHLDRNIELIHPDDRERVVSEVQAIIATGGAIKFEYRLLRPDGELRYVEGRAECLLGPDGTAASIRGTLQDITDRRQIQEALLVSQERMANAQQVAHVGDWEWDIARDVFSVSDEFYRIYGLEPQSIVITLASGLALIHPGDQARIAGEVQHVLAGGEGHIFEYRIIRPDGEERIVEGTSALQRGPEGTPLVLRGTLQDITERKQAQLDRIKLEEQLRQSQKMEAVGQLAGGVAHDFNNLLTIIIGYTDILLGDLARESEMREPLALIRESADRAALLTHQLLAFSRKQVMQPQLLNLNKIVAETEKMLRRLIGEDISVVTALDAELYPVKLDPGQFVQVLLNLAVNARDAMPAGGKLSIKTSNFYADTERATLMPDYHEGPYVLLSFSDDGHGMSPEVKARVFEPFFTTKPQGKGTGLGLSTVFGIIKQSGGNIEVYSEPGFGTTFKIYLPAVAGAALVDARQAAEAVPGARGQETILLVEDEQGVRLVAMLVLEAQGYYVMDACGAEEALRLVAEHQGNIDLLLTDVVMPEVNGRELADEVIRQREGIKVLFMSGYTDDAVFRHGLLYKDVAFLQKPFTPTSLAQKVREVLDGK